MGVLFGSADCQAGADSVNSPQWSMTSARGPPLAAGGRPSGALPQCCWLHWSVGGGQRSVLIFRMISEWL